MGFGGVYKKQAAAQDQLTNLSNSLITQAGEAKRQAAEAEASQLRKQGDQALFDATQEALLKEREGQIAYGNQAQQYLNSGVFLMGSPLNVLNETRRMNQIEIDSIKERARSLQELYYQKAGQTSRGGMSDYLQAIGSTAINSQQNALSQQQQRSSMYRGLIGNIIGGGFSLLKAFL